MIDAAIIAGVLTLLWWGRTITKDDDNLPKGKRGW
jgi:hypothetical protein